MGLNGLSKQQLSAPQQQQQRNALGLQQETPSFKPA